MEGEPNIATKLEVTRGGGGLVAKILHREINIKCVAI